MEKSKGVLLQKIVERFELEILVKGDGYEDCRIISEDINRPGLQLGGYFDFFDEERVQLIGRAEDSFLHHISAEQRESSFDTLFSYNIPAMVVARGLEPFPECLEAAKRHHRTLLITQRGTSAFAHALNGFMQQELSPRITRHGVLMDIYGEGVLILGESGVGKSETAIELIKRGHRLIADDAVEIRRLHSNRLEGTAPELIRYYMELRGIGVVDVRRLFGMSAIKTEADIDMVIHLELWQDDAAYDRLGMETQYMSILDVQVPALTIPVKPGRNLAAIIEVAAMNNRNKKMGYNAAQEFTRQLDAHFDKAMTERNKD